MFIYKDRKNRSLLWLHIYTDVCIYLCLKSGREVGGWGRDPKKCTGRDWGMGSSTI